MTKPYFKNGQNVRPLQENSSVEPDAYYTTRRVAGLFGVSLRTVQLWCDSGILKFAKTPGGHRRILGSGIIALRLKQQYEAEKDAILVYGDLNYHEVARVTGYDRSFTMVPAKSFAHLIALMAQRPYVAIVVSDLVESSNLKWVELFRSAEAAGIFPKSTQVIWVTRTNFMDLKEEQALINQEFPCLQMVKVVNDESRDDVAHAGYDFVVRN